MASCYTCTALGATGDGMSLSRALHRPGYDICGDSDGYVGAKSKRRVWLE